MECPPHLPVHHHLRPLDASTFTLFPCPRFELYTPPSTGTLTRSRRCNLYGVIGGRTKSAGMAHPTRSLSCPHWAVQMMSYLARAQPAGDLRTAQITLTAPFPPSPLRHAVKCLVGVVDRRVSIVSRVSGFQSSRVNESQGLKGFKGTKNLRVFRSRGIEALLRLTGAF